MSAALSGVRGRQTALVVLPTAALAMAFAGVSVRTPRTELLLVRGGKPLPVVLRHDAIPAERTAAEELVEHLGLMTGRRFSVMDEFAVRSARPAIHVGATGWVRSRGFPCDDRGPEGWHVATRGDHVVLCGGRPRGTLYSVYRFLEDDLGVRWWTPYERDVPSRPAPGLAPGDRSGAPVFGYRDMNGVAGPRVFGARSRLNGHFSGLRGAHGGSERYGPPSQVHNFFAYVPPEEFFADRPEFFSEIAGLRYSDETQLCLTDEGLFDVVLERLVRYIDETYGAARRMGVEPPRLFDFSQNDWGHPCDCERCTAANAAAGSRAGTIIVFVNRLADVVRKRHANVRIDTLAYGWSFRPPRSLRVHEGVIVRLAPLYGRDFSLALDAPVHGPIREALAGWSAQTAHLWVWDYVVTFGDGGDLPLPTLDRVAADLRRYRDHGVEGVFLQQDPLVAADMLDLKRWVLARLLEDASRDPAALRHTFIEGYYGPAAGPIGRYRESLASVVAARPAAIAFDAPPEAFAFLDRKFILEAQSRFDEALRVVAGDVTRTRRVRHARLMLDAATLHRWDVLFEGAEQGNFARNPPLDREAIIARWKRTFLEQIAIRVSPAGQEAAREDVDWQVRDWTE